MKRLLACTGLFIARRRCFCANTRAQASTEEPGRH